MKIVIIGAGLTGLSAAYYLQNGKHEVVMFEQAGHAAGLLRSVEVDGFWFDHTGHLMHVSDARFRQFISDCLGFEHCYLLARKSFIYTYGTHVAYPFQQNLYGLPPQIIWECIDGFIKREHTLVSPENFSQFVHKHFGAGFAKHFFFPYNSKLLNMDPVDIKPTWTSRFVPSTDLETIIKGALFPTHLSQAGYNANFYYPKQGGINSLVNGILSKLTVPIKYNHSLVQVDVEQKVVIFANGHAESYDHLITTAPLPVLMRAVRNDNHFSWREGAELLKCNSVVNLNLGFNQTHEKEFGDRHWIYYPEKEFLFYRLGFWHNLAPNMVPAGCSSLYGEVSVPTDYPSHLIEDLANMAQEQIFSLFNISASSVVVNQTLFLKYAYVVYDAWREHNLPIILEHLAQKQIHSIGRFGAWKYSSMQEAVLDGYQIANQLQQQNLQTLLTC